MNLIRNRVCWRSAARLRPPLSDQSHPRAHGIYPIASGSNSFKRRRSKNLRVRLEGNQAGIGSVGLRQNSVGFPIEQNFGDGEALSGDARATGARGGSSELEREDLSGFKPPPVWGRC